MIEAKSEKFWELIDKAAVVKQVGTGFTFTEGPVTSRRGFTLFSDIPNNRIHKWERGEMSVFRENSNKANGLTFDHQGRLLTAEGGGRVTRTEKNGTITVLADEGLQGPNDLVYSIDGSVYFTDLPKGKVYQITRERSGVGGAPPKGIVRVVYECQRPNGVALAPNQQKIYIADIVAKVIVADIAPDGSVRNAKDFAAEKVDGLKTDEGGNVWMATGAGVVVYSPAGEHLGTVKVPEQPSNLCFGEGFRGLYITARKSLYHVPTKASGTRTF